MNEEDFALPFERINQALTEELSVRTLLGMHLRSHQHFARLIGYGHTSGKELAILINAHYWLMKEMLRREFNHHFQDKLDTLALRFRGQMSPTDTISKSFKSADGLYVIQNHADLIVSGKKKAIVKSRRFLLKNQKYALLTTKQGKGKALGLMTISSPRNISLNEFKQLSETHCITDEERIKRWGNKRDFWIYDVQKFERFSPEMDVDIPKEIQSIVKNVNFIDNISDYDPKKVDNKVLGDDWRIVNAWYSTVRSGEDFKYSKLQVMKLARVIFLEMESRGFKFHPDKMKPFAKELFTKITDKTDFFMKIFPGSESERGPEINLEEVTEQFDSFKLYEDFVMIVGSLANWKKTTGDIDILIKAPVDSDIFKLTSWRFQRAFPDLKDRFHFSEYAGWQGPFTSHIHAFDLVAIPASMELHDMAKIVGWQDQCEESKREDKIKFGRLFYLAKPMHGRHKEEHYTIDTVIDVMNLSWRDWKKRKVFVEKKHDGVHCSVAKSSSGNVKIVSEDGNDYTPILPTLVKEFSEKKGEFVIVGEIESWKDGKHQQRSVTAGILNSKHIHPEEKTLRINVFDKLYHKE